MSDRATFGLPKNIAAALSYVGLVFTGILFYVFEREDKFVKFHALQSIIFFGGMAVLKYALEIAFGILKFIPILGWIFSILGGLVFYAVGIVSLVTWAWLIINAVQGREYRIPYIGKIVASQVSR